MTDEQIEHLLYLSRVGQMPRMMTNLHGIGKPSLYGGWNDQPPLAPSVPTC